MWRRHGSDPLVGYPIHFGDRSTEYAIVNYTVAYQVEEIVAHGVQTLGGQASNAAKSFIQRAGVLAIVSQS